MRLTDDQLQTLSNHYAVQSSGNARNTYDCLTELLELRAVVAKLPEIACGTRVIPNTSVPLFAVYGDGIIERDTDDL